MYFFDIINSAFPDKNYTLFPENISNTKINGIADNSNDVLEGYLFAAITGYKNNGIIFINDAIKNGASAILTDADENLCQNICDKAYIIKVADTRDAFAHIAKAFYNNIDEKFDFIGVTGTNGKTSTTTYISHIFNYCHTSTAIIGTLGSFSNDNSKIKTQRTTPGILELYKLFSYYSEKNIRAIAMEVSSHALELKRVSPLHFKFAVFTNITEDHLDFHKTMEEYKKAKKKLFYQCDYAVINVDDEFGKELANSIPANVVTYSICNNNADYYASDIINLPCGTTFTLNIKKKEYYTVKIKTPGLFSVYNTLAAIAVSIEYGLDASIVCQAISKAPSVNGRFEAIKNNSDINIILDYAHTPDGIKNVLLTAKEFTKGRIISVFGCGGERETEKRSIMGKISAELSDYTVITSDNPRNENELLIAYEIAKGIESSHLLYNIIIDRQKAIEHALKYAKSGDTVLIMGKGHEEYQQIGNIKYSFCDRDIIKNTIIKLKL